MKKLVSILIIMVMLIIPCEAVLATNNEEEQMQAQANEILSSIEAQTMDNEANARFVYALFIVVGISMVFEYFVRGYKAEIREKKEKGESCVTTRKKLWITYGIHAIFMLILAIVLKFIVALTDVYVIFLVIATFYVVEFAPLFSFSFWKKKKGDK